MTTYGFTKSTPLDRCYRFAPALDITPLDEGAAVYRFAANKRGRPVFVGSVIRGALVRPQR